MLVGSILALAWAAVGASTDGMRARREQLEREVTALSTPLAELARLERAAERDQAAAAQAQAGVGPIVRLRSLLERLSREARAGVAVSRLQQSGEGIELRVRAANSAAYVSWAQRLANLPGLESTETVELKSIAAPPGRQSRHAVEAGVRLQWRVAPSMHAPLSPPLRRTALGDRERAVRDER